MKKLILVLAIIFLFAGSRNPDADKPYGLMVEFIREPQKVKILDLKPEFTWIVPADAGTQTAWQILVASSKKKLETNTPDIWDSKRITGNTSSEVGFGGTDLAPETEYFWKVRIWNDHSKPSSWSEIQEFRTGDPHGYATTHDIFEITMVKPVKLLKTGDNHYFIDFGKDAFGTLVLRINPVITASVTIHLGEKLSGINNIDKNPGGTIRYTKSTITVNPGIKEYVIALQPDSWNTGPEAIHLPDSFGVVIPFRYCEIEDVPGTLEPENVCRKIFNIYFDEKQSDFNCSDSVLNRVWDICKYTMKATSFTGIYIDGDRERIPYEADAYINQLGHYYTDREYSMARMTCEYFMKHPTWPTEWILQTVLLFYNDYMFTGNIESLRANYDGLKYKTLSSLAREDGLISSKGANDVLMKNLGFTDVKKRIRDIVDWPPAEKDSGWKLAMNEGERDGYDMVEINTVVNAFYYRNLVLMSEIASRLGRNEDSGSYKLLSVKVKDSFNKVFLDSKNGKYVDGENSLHSSLHANMMALVFGLVPDEFRSSVVAFIKSRGMACSVYGSQFLLEGLYKAGEAEYALSLMNATSDRSWWNMIKSGATMTMEAWDMKYKPNSDWNHAWGASPANIIPGYMWGITPAEPGYAKAVIHPQLANLKNSKIKMPTIRGTIIAEFSDRGKSKQYDVTIPGNMECDFIISEHVYNLVTLNGRKIVPAGNILSLKPGLNRIELYNK